MLVNLPEPTVLAILNASYTQIHDRSSSQRRGISATLVLTKDVLFIVGMYMVHF